ncbi:MAG: hypothetical protein ACUVR0_03285 [Candidatus Aminicenantales bacterium]
MEKTPLDLYQMGDSRDFGIAFRGSIGKKELFSYHIMIGNGEGVKSEVNKEKRFMGAFHFKLLNAFPLNFMEILLRVHSREATGPIKDFLDGKRRELV